MLNTLNFSTCIADQTPIGFGVKPNEIYTWKVDEINSIANNTHLTRWVVRSIVNDGLIADVMDNGGSGWDQWVNNEEIVTIYEHGEFSTGYAGPFILPIPVNATCLVMQTAFTWAYYSTGVNMTWNWDGHILEVWDDFFPDIGDPIEDYYLKAIYNDAGVLLNWTESYFNNGYHFTMTKILIESGQSTQIPAATPTELSIELGSSLSSTLLLNSTDLVNLTLATSEVAPKGIELNNSVAYLEINCSDQTRVNFPVFLVFNYTDADMLARNITPSQLAVWYLNASNGWEHLPTVVDLTARTITVRLDHFSYYALAQGTPQIINPISTTDTNPTTNQEPTTSIGINLGIYLIVSMGLTTMILVFRRREK
jgi:hypothetical protein